MRTHANHEASTEKSTELVYMWFKDYYDPSNGWQPLSTEPLASRCDVNPQIFMIIGSAAITQAGSGETVAIILLYKPTIEAMKQYIERLCTARELRQAYRKNIIVGSPEAMLGSSVGASDCSVDVRIVV